MKTIALLDFSLAGHHLSFMRSFAKILLEQGHRVICIIPANDQVQSWIKEQIPDKQVYFHQSTYHYTPIKTEKWGRLNYTIQVLHRWKEEAKLVRKAEQEHRVTVDFVFYAWLDNQLAQYIPPFILDRLFPYKWSGLYFHPYSLRKEEAILNRKAVWRDYDSIFLSSNCQSVTVHDIGIVEKFRKRINKQVIHFPETADDTAPDYNHPHYKEIKEHSKGRIVVGMIGCEKHKGTLTMMRMARMADPEQYFFCFLGILPQATFPDAEWNEVQDFIAEKRENCFFHFHSIPEGAAYNGAFCAIDIPFLVYDDFISSSNRLTKAAIFQKLVLASDNYCVGEDVKKFNLGVAVLPQNADAALKGLEQLAIKIRTEDYPYKEWEAYKELNSNEMLYQRFQEVLA